MLMFLVIAVVVGFCAALLAWWLLRPRVRHGVRQGLSQSATTVRWPNRFVESLVDKGVLRRTHCRWSVVR